MQEPELKPFPIPTVLWIGGKWGRSLWRKRVKHSNRFNGQELLTEFADYGLEATHWRRWMRLIKPRQTEPRPRRAAAR